MANYHQERLALSKSTNVKNFCVMKQRQAETASLLPLSSRADIATETATANLYFSAANHAVQCEADVTTQKQFHCLLRQETCQIKNFTVSTHITFQFFANFLSHSGLASIKYYWSHTAFVYNSFDLQRTFFLQS